MAARALVVLTLVGLAAACGDDPPSVAGDASRGGGGGEGGVDAPGGSGGAGGAGGAAGAGGAGGVAGGAGGSGGEGGDTGCVEPMPLAPFCIGDTCLLEKRAAIDLLRGADRGDDGALYLLGRSGDRYQLRVTRWDGAAWSLVGQIPLEVSDDEGNLVLQAYRPDDVWVAGLHLVHFDGAAWRRVERPAASSGRVLGVGRTPAGALWILDGGGVHLRDGGGWTTMEAPVAGAAQLHVRGEDEVWVVGRQEVARWDGARWSKDEAPAPIGAFDAAGARVVRGDAHLHILEEDGSWSAVALGGAQVQSIAQVGAEIFAIVARPGEAPALVRVGAGGLEPVAVPEGLVEPFFSRLVADGASLWLLGTTGIHQRADCWLEHQPRRVRTHQAIAGPTAEGPIAVDGSGWAGRWDGARWITETEALPGGRSAAVVAAGEVWVITGGSGVFRRSASGWMPMIDEPRESWQAIAAAEDGSIWIGSSVGAIRRWDGSAWSDAGRVSGAVAVLAGGDGIWAAATAPEGTTILHRREAGWESVAQLPGAVDRLLPTSPGEVLALGPVAHDEGWVARIGPEGIEFLDVGAPPPSWNGVVVDGGAVELLGTRAVFRKGAEGDRLSLYPAMLRTSWAGFGVRWSADGVGNLLRDDASGRHLFPADVNRSLRAIWGAAANDVWIVGDRGAVLHWDGATLGPPAHGASGDLHAVWGAGGNVWAAGAGVACLAGASCVESPEPGLLLDLHGTSASDVWAVGVDVRHFDGAAWTRMERPTEGAVRAVYAAAPGDVFAIGDDGAIVRWDGAAWSIVHRSALRLTGIDGSGPNDVWVSAAQPAHGDEATLLHWDGATWSEVRWSPYGARRLSGLRRDGAGRTWVAAGDRLFVGDGAGWQTLPAPFEAREVLWIDPDDGSIWIDSATGLARTAPR